MSMEKESRERILEAAERLFAQKGFAATSVREILRDAEVSSPMLYYYFGSKQDLLNTLAKERFERFRTRARERVGQAETARETFVRFAEILFAGVKENPITYRFLVSITQSSLTAHSGEEFFKMKTAHTRFLGEHLERIRPEVESNRRLFAVLTFHSMVTGFLMMFLAGLQKRLDGELAAAIGERAAAILDDAIPIPQLGFTWQAEDRSDDR
ncbi:MAG: TetR/AcrR family transcriptional regulator [Bradymonadales bacterium]|nr:TetR/AcrR family transcriptional regulator [Bradymonadales bacterium]